MAVRREEGTSAGPAAKGLLPSTLAPTCSGADTFTSTAPPDEDVCAFTSTAPPDEGAFASAPSEGADSPAGAEGELTTVPEADGERPARGRGFPVAGWDRYEFLSTLGRGGMGEVYEARDRRLGREVALKFIRGADPDRVLRLLQEARTQARIDHPNVCKVYEVGEVFGKAYVAMQLVRGQTLDEAALEMTLPAKVRALKLVAEAVHEAHRLGVVHRDLKPSNVMIDQTDGGHLRPVVMDFGLAYEVTRGHGLTAAGALLGTPAYMPPEQARGDLRSVDQRSDVYSLGATLYELLVGVAPFRDSTLAGLLDKIQNEEPRPLRARAPQVPADLETIVLKCLHKEPAGRYPSARALADDLGRFLDGEPVLGRRPGLRERLARKARRHRALSALSAVSILVTSMLGAFGARSWIEARRARAEAAGRARLGEELGQEVKEIEWFLRAAYALPLHDTGPEQRRVRDRMAAIEARHAGSGGPSGGLVRYAVGRGRLALGEFEAADRELARAEAAGVDTPGLHYARGRALGEIYRRALDDARRGGDPSWVAGRQRALERQYLAPALAELEKSRGIELESPRYLEGLLAFYRHDYDAAAPAAGQAADEAPWAYEARRLAGDVAYARSMGLLERGAYDEARAGLDGAAALYERAAEVGRSDALTYEALAEALMRRAEADQRQGRPRQEALGRALEAAGKATRAAPSRASGHTRRAYVLMNWYWMTKFEGGGEDPKRVFDAWVDAATRAIELDPRDVYAHDTLGYAHFLRGLDAARGGADPEPAFDDAIARLNQALALEPNYPWGLNDLAAVYVTRGGHRRRHGADPGPDFAEAERHLLEATRNDPSYLIAYATLADLYKDMAAHDASRGIDPEPQVGRAIEAGERALALDGHYYRALNAVAGAELTRANYLVDAGADPRPAIERTLAYLERSRANNPSFARTSLYAAQARLVAARHELAARRDPRADLDAGQRSLEAALRADEGCVECHVARAGLLLLEATWRRERGEAEAPVLERALAEARRAVAMFSYAEAHQGLARVYLRLAEAQPARGGREAIEAGLAQADLALRLEPGSAASLALRAGLLLARARAERAEPGRREAAANALADLGRAFAANPLARREFEGLEREARRLADGAGP
jgi:eukaryotic-like serine/threonine-protein kinase